MPNEALVERFLAVTEGTSFSERVILKFAAALVRQLPASYLPANLTSVSHICFSKDPNRFSAFEFVLRAPSPRAILSFLSPLGIGNLPGQSDQG